MEASPRVGNNMPTWTRLEDWPSHNRLNHSLNWGFNSNSGINNSSGNIGSIRNNDNNIIGRSSILLSLKVLHYSIHVSLEHIHLSLELSQGFLVGSIFLFNVYHDLFLVCSSKVLVVSLHLFCEDEDGVSIFFVSKVMTAWMNEMHAKRILFPHFHRIPSFFNVQHKLKLLGFPRVAHAKISFDMMS